MKHLLLIVGISVMLWLTGVAAYAADTTKDYVPLTGIYGITDGKYASGSERLENMFKNAFNLLIGFAGLAAVVMISYGAILYMGESITKKQTGKTVMWDAVIGLLLVLFTYTILFTINPNILKLNIGIKDLNISGKATSATLKGNTYSIPDTTEARANCLKQNGIITEPKEGSTQLQCTVPFVDIPIDQINAGSNLAIYRGGTDGVAWCRGAFDASQLNAYASRCPGGGWKNEEAQTLTTYQLDGTAVKKQFTVGTCREERIVKITKTYTAEQLNAWGTVKVSVWALLVDESKYQDFESGCSGIGKFTQVSLNTLKGTGTFREYVSEAKLSCPPGVNNIFLVDKCLPPDHRKY